LFWIGEAGWLVENMALSLISPTIRKNAPAALNAQSE
jgi:hypothetical protein